MNSLKLWPVGHFTTGYLGDFTPDRSVDFCDLISPIRITLSYFLVSGVFCGIIG